MINIGIIGGSGMLGSDLTELLANNPKYSVTKYDFPDFDITKQECLIKAVDDSDIIVNCAAYTAVDDAEKNVETCYAVNADAVKTLAELAFKNNKYLIHISTDFVFGDSSNTLLSEESRTAPLNVYGASKLKGEQLLLKSNPNAAVIRVQWTYGKHGNHFISKILELAKKFDSLKIVNDQIGSPSCTEDVSKAILDFIIKQPKGLYHFAAKNYASRCETAEFIIKTLNMDVKINPCSSAEFPAPAKRPLNSRFDCSKIDKRLTFERPAWQDALKRFLDCNYNISSTERS